MLRHLVSHVRPYAVFLLQQTKTLLFGNFFISYLISSRVCLFISTVVPIFSGVPVSSRVSAKIQQLVNTLKRPKRPPLREFFVDDFEELLEGKFFFYLFF